MIERGLDWENQVLVLSLTHQISKCGQLWHPESQFPHLQNGHVLLHLCLRGQVKCNGRRNDPRGERPGFRSQLISPVPTGQVSCAPWASTAHHPAANRGRPTQSSLRLLPALRVHQPSQRTARREVIPNCGCHANAAYIAIFFMP